MKESADARVFATCLGVLHADDAEVGLLPGRREDLACREELALVQSAGEMEDARALHHRVVDVEERGHRGVGRRGEGGLHLGRRGSGLAGESRTLLEVQHPAALLRESRGQPLGAREAAGEHARCAPRCASRCGRSPGSAGTNGRPRSRLWDHRPHAHDPRRVLARGRGGRRPGPDALAVVEAAGRGCSPGPSSRTRSRGSPPASVRRGWWRVSGSLLALGNRIEFVDGLPRGPARADRRRTGQPAPTSGELDPDDRRPSGCRIVIGDAETIGSVRGGRPAPGRPGGRDRRAGRRPGGPLARAAGLRRGGRAGRG